MTENRPLWRWALFCLSLDLFMRTRDWPRARAVSGWLMAWCVLPEWLGCPVHTDGRSSCWRAFDRSVESW